MHCIRTYVIGSEVTNAIYRPPLVSICKYEICNMMSFTFETTIFSKVAWLFQVGYSLYSGMLGTACYTTRYLNKVSRDYSVCVVYSTYSHKHIHIQCICTCTYHRNVHYTHTCFTIQYTRTQYTCIYTHV